VRFRAPERGPLSDEELINGKAPNIPRLQGAEDCKVIELSGHSGYQYQCIFRPSGASAVDVQTRLVEKATGYPATSGGVAVTPNYEARGAIVFISSADYTDGENGQSGKRPKKNPDKVGVEAHWSSLGGAHSDLWVSVSSYHPDHPTNVNPQTSVVGSSETNEIQGSVARALLLDIEVTNQLKPVRVTGSRTWILGLSEDDTYTPATKEGSSCPGVAPVRNADYASSSGPCSTKAMRYPIFDASEQPRGCCPT
jgi:hypothetical protein